MQCMAGKDYTPVIVTLEITEHESGWTKHKEFVTNYTESKQRLLEAISEALDAGDNLKVIHDD